LDETLIDFVAEAAAVLPALIDQLEIGLTPKVDLGRIMQQADRFANGERPTTALPPEALAAPVAASPAAGSSAMDPVLADIFVKEMRSHLAAIRTYLADVARLSAP